MSATTMLRPAPGVSLPTASGGIVVIRAWRGEGSYARVYRAAYARPGDSPLDATQCALKLPKPEIAEAADRLRREGEVLARLNHPRVVKLLDRGDGTAPFLALEWLEGETLLDLVHARRRLPLRQALELLAGLAEALAHFHERGLAHGDVRGQNLLVLPTRGAVLTDPEPVAPATTAGDVQAAGVLLSLMLTGQETAAGVPLTTAGGHNRAVVELSTRLASANPPSARGLLEEVQALRARL
jgi:serine/threonine-protein kinase